VSTLSARAGQTVTPALALATLVPAQSRLEAHLYAPSSAVGFLHEQQTVLLRYEAFPYQKFGLQHGRITSVALTPLSPIELAGQAWVATAREPMYRIAVALERQAMPIGGGAARSLAPGMQLEADVPIERRRLVEWLFAPVVGWAQRL
jgi:membrane fusion protein